MRHLFFSVKKNFYIEKLRSLNIPNVAILYNEIHMLNVYIFNLYFIQFMENWKTYWKFISIQYMWLLRKWKGGWEESRTVKIKTKLDKNRSLKTSARYSK